MFCAGSQYPRGRWGGSRIILVAVGYKVSMSALCTLAFASDALQIVFYGVVGCSTVLVEGVRRACGPLYQLSADRGSRRYMGESTNDCGCALGNW